jgi:hypothetical protein
MRVARRTDGGTAGNPAQSGLKLVEQLVRGSVGALPHEEGQCGIQIPVCCRTDTDRGHARLRPSALRLRTQ